MAIEKKKTPNLNLPLIQTDEYATTQVVEFIQGIQGDTNESAFNIIDSAVASKQNALEFNAVIPEHAQYTEWNTLKVDGKYYLLAGTSHGGEWGGIIGTLANQTDLQNALNAKANVASPNFTGTIYTTGSLFVNSNREVATKNDITNAMLFATAEQIDDLDYDSPSLNEDVQEILGGSY